MPKNIIIYLIIHGKFLFFYLTTLIDGNVFEMQYIFVKDCLKEKCGHLWGQAWEVVFLQGTKTIDRFLKGNQSVEFGHVLSL